MQNISKEYIIKKAKEHEKNKEWLQASKFYNKTSELVTKKKEKIEKAKIQEKIGFCFYKAALQTKSNLVFRNLLKQAIEAYEKEIQILQETNNENYQQTIRHANALINYVKSWLERLPHKKKQFLTKWWNQEKQVLSSYEDSEDLCSVGRLCNDLLEYSIYNRFWLVSNYIEQKKIAEECIILAEKAIKTFSNLNDNYELAKAYCFASWYYSWSDWFWESEDKIKLLNQKCQNFSNKALELSRKTGDAWLISWTYLAANGAAQKCNLDPTLARKYAEKILDYAIIAKDNFLMGFGNSLTSGSTTYMSKLLEDPDQQKENYKKAERLAQAGTHNFEIINHRGFWISHIYNSLALTGLAAIEIDRKSKKDLLIKANKIIEEGIKRLKGYKRLYSALFSTTAITLILLSETIDETQEKRNLLYKAHYYAKRNIIIQKKMAPFAYLDSNISYFQLGLVYNQLSVLETDYNEKSKLLYKAMANIKKSIEIIEKKRKLYTQSIWVSIWFFGRYYYQLGGILNQLTSLRKDEKNLKEGIRAYQKAIFYFKKAQMSTNVAESYWHIAQLFDQMVESMEAAKNYELASEAYEKASRKIPQLEEFYKNYCLYMQAWSQIEQARYNHSIEEYNKAKQHYEKASKLHELAKPWSYLASNYLAWTNVEEAEYLSRKENTRQAKQAFQKAIEQFDKAEKSITQKIEENPSQDEKTMSIELSKIAKIRGRYCQARILLEEAKILDRKGKYLQSSKSYGQAAQDIESIIKHIETESEQKELKLIAVLCQAWQKMANAEETTSSNSYLEAAKLFEKVRDLSVTKKTSLWALGNSSFCKGLAAGIKYQSTMNLTENAMAKRHIKSAASSYLQAGFNNASEYAKATQRLFDAYVFMNQAESEADPEKKAKQYQMAEKLLQISAGSFMKAKQPEKTTQVQQILNSVKEEKTLAVSLNEVLHAPTIASTTMSFTTPKQTNEVSVGLKQFDHANVQANLIAGIKNVKIGQSFCLTLEFINAGKEPALLTRVEDFVPTDFFVVKKPEIYRLENNCLNMKGKQLAPLKLVEAKLVLQPSKKGIYQIKPKVYYLDERGQNKTLQLKTIEIRVEEEVLEHRMSTGTKELDSLLLGGIPEGYAVALTGFPSDEREHLIKNFLKAGTKQDQTTFYITTEATRLDNLIEKPNFYLFLCNPKPKIPVPDLPNIIKLRSKTDLNNLNMALARTSRNLQQTQNTTKRIVIEIVSDVLLRHGPEVTRRWISELITDLTSKGFTMLAVLDSGMHPPDQANAITYLFDGEISITQTQDPLECKKSIQVKKLRGQEYIKNPICLTKH